MTLQRTQGSPIEVAEENCNSFSLWKGVEDGSGFAKVYVD